MSAESYTRWTSSASDDEDDEDDRGRSIGKSGGRSGAASGDGEGEGGMITILSRPQPSLSFDQAARARMLCIVILVCLMCIVCGAFVGYMSGRKEGAANARHTEVHKSTPQHPDDHLPLDLIANLQKHIMTNSIKGYSNKLGGLPRSRIVDYLKSTWKLQGFDTTTTSFTVMLSKPNRADPNKVILEYHNEPEKLLNPLSKEQQEFPPYIAYSSSGVATGPLVYGHYGERDDFQVLQARDANIQGSIALIRMGRLHPGVKVHNAEQAGAAGVLLYPDPEDFKDPKEDGATHPHGTGLPEDGIVWGHIKTMSGDPSTPYLPSIDHIYRLPETSLPIPGIPVHTISGDMAKQLMGVLGGPEVPSRWWGGLGAQYLQGGIWAEGEGIRNLTLKVTNVLESTVITNVHATLPALDETKVIHIGCHWDYWFRIGADPGTGLSAMLALSEAWAKSFPEGTNRKTIFSAWDAEEPGIIGSTEFTQLYSTWLESTALSYFNLDQALEGSGSLEVAASPLLREVIRKAALYVAWPDGDDVNVRDGWLSTIPQALRTTSNDPTNSDFNFHNPGGGGDFVSFVAQRGISSAHFSASGLNFEHSYALSHSQYDSLVFAFKALDPNYKWTKMVASLVGVVSLIMAQVAVPPTHFTELSQDLLDGWNRFRDRHKKHLALAHNDFDGIIDAIENHLISLHDEMKTLDDWYHEPPKTQGDLQYFRHSEARVHQLIQVERQLLGPRGVGRTFTTHLMLGPDPEDPCVPTHFPHVSREILHAVMNQTPWESVHQEFSYILASLVSFKELFPKKKKVESNW